MTNEDRHKARIRQLFRELQRQSARVREQDFLLARYRALVDECLEKYAYDKGDDVLPILIRFRDNRRT